MTNDREVDIEMARKFKAFLSSIPPKTFAKKVLGMPAKCLDKGGLELAADIQRAYIDAIKA